MLVLLGTIGCDMKALLLFGFSVFELEKTWQFWSAVGSPQLATTGHHWPQLAVGFELKELIQNSAQLIPGGYHLDFLILF